MIRVARVVAAASVRWLMVWLLGVVMVVHLFVMLRLVVYDGHVNADVNAV